MTRALRQATLKTQDLVYKAHAECTASMNGFWGYEFALARWPHGWTDDAVAHLVDALQDIPKRTRGVCSALRVRSPSVSARFEKSRCYCETLALAIEKQQHAAAAAKSSYYCYNGSHCTAEEGKYGFHRGECQVSGSAASKLTRLSWPSVPDSFVLSLCNPAMAHYMVRTVIMSMSH
jgi:hypothetical protein